MQNYENVLRSKFEVLSSLLIILVLITALVISGCGQTSTQIGSGAGAGSGDSITLSGSLYTGTIRTQAVTTQSADGQIIKVLADSGTPITEQKIIAIGATTKEVVFADAKTGSDGSFKITIPKEKFKNESFYLNVIDEKSTFKAPVVFSSTTVAGVKKAVMGIKPGEASLDIGKIVFEAAKKVAVPAVEPAKLAASVVARLKQNENFVPVGADDKGRGTGEAKYTGDVGSDPDGDLDGIPDVCDIDDDGDGIVDGLDSTPRASGVAEFKGSDLVDGTTFFTNLPLNYEEYSSDNYSTAIDPGLSTRFAIHLTMKQGVSPDVYSEVKVVEGPPWLATSIITGVRGIMPADTSWKNNDYKLFKGDNDWAVWVDPHNSADPPAAGQTIKFEAKKSDGTKEYFFATLTYVFSDIPRLVTYFDNVLAHPTLDRSKHLIELSTYRENSKNAFKIYIPNEKKITLIFTKPKDDQGNSLGPDIMNYVLDGITYHNYGEAGKSYDLGAVSITPKEVLTAVADGGLTQGEVDQIKNISYVGSNNLSNYLYIHFNPDQPKEGVIIDKTYSSFKLDIKAGSQQSGGGNASHLVNFYKQ